MISEIRFWLVSTGEITVVRSACTISSHGALPNSTRFTVGLCVQFIGVLAAVIACAFQVVHLAALFWSCKLTKNVLVEVSVTVFLGLVRNAPSVTLGLSP